MKHLESKPYKMVHLFILAVIAGIGTIFIFVCTKKYGTAFSADSVNYMAAAHNLLAGKGFLMCDGEPFIAWPPLYPTLLALLKFFRVDYIVSVRCVSALAFGFIMYLSGLWVLKNTSRLFLAVLCSLGILLSKPLTYVFCYAWSETIFIVLLMMFFLLLPSFIKESTIKRGLLLALITAAACLTRYIGGVLFLLLVLSVLVNKKQVLWRRAASAAFLAMVSVFPLALWLLRNRLVTGMLTGRRLPTDTPVSMLSKNMNLAGNVIASWFLPGQIVKGVPGWIFFLVFSVLVVIGFISILVRSRKRKLYWLESPKVVLVLFVIIFTAGVVSAASRVIIDPIDDRLLAPIYIPAVLLFWASLGNIFPLDTKPTQQKKDLYVKLIRAGIVGGIFIGIWFGAGSNNVFSRAERMVKYGAGGRNSVRWHASETVTWLKSNQLSGSVFSNDCFTVFFFTRHTCKMSPALPTRRGCTSAELRQESERQVAEFKEALQAKDGAYLVWFLPNRRDYLYDVEQLQGFCRMRIVQQFRDGAIIALYPK